MTPHDPDPPLPGPSVAGVTVRPESPGSSAGRLLRDEFWTHVCALLGLGDRGGAPAGDLDDLVPPHGTFLVAAVDGVDTGCAGGRLLAGGRAEVKRLYVAPRGRGHGLGRTLLRRVEGWAREQGARELVLDTHGDLTAARRLYDAEGFTETAPYNDNPDAQVWYVKPLT